MARHGFLERILLSLVLQRPYRCHACWRRFYERPLGAQSSG
jgi:hypothetical protein